MKSTAFNSLDHLASPAILLAEQSVMLLEKDQIIEKKSGVIITQKKRIAILEEALRLSKIKRFAPTSESSCFRIYAGESGFYRAGRTSHQIGHHAQASHQTSDGQYRMCYIIIAQ